MGKNSAPQPPPPPDPFQTAQAQTQENQQTAIANAELNRINQYGPNGSVTYQVTGTNPDGTPIYSQTTSLSPAQQQQLDLQNQLASSLLGTATGQLGRVNTTMSTPFNFNGAPAETSNINLSKLPQMVTNVPVGHLTNSISLAGPIDMSLGNAGGMQRTIGGLPGIQDNLNFNGAPGLPNGGDFSGDRNNVTNSVYNQALSRLTPQFQQSQSDLDAKLANMGIVRGSDAWNREETNLSNQRNDANSQALFNAINAGANEQSTLFGEALNARQQAVGETSQQGQFANAADQQAYDQSMGSAGLFNDTQAQQFAQALAGGQFANSAQNQRFDQNAQSASFTNASLESAFQMALQNAGLADTANQQAYNQQAGNAALENQARQEYITEQSYLRNLPLQDVATLMGTAGSPQMPSFQPVSNVGMANTDLASMIYNSSNMQQQQFTQQQQMNANNKGQMFGALGSVGGAVAMSDRRLKDNIKYITTLWNGVKTYVFNYIGDKAKQFGVMAQEVTHIPGAVYTMPDGTMLVDYGKVW